MTDRDRLAADLRDAARAFADDPAAYLDRGDAYDAMADRLIALGWTRRDPVAEMGAAEIDRLVREATRPVTVSDLRGLVTDPAWAEGHRRGDDIDEERLARALGRPCSAITRHDPAVIAKAYREDTDATD